MLSNPSLFSRRAAIQQMACGVGGLGLATLLADEARAAGIAGAPGRRGRISQARPKASSS